MVVGKKELETPLPRLLTCSKDAGTNNRWLVTIHEQETKVLASGGSISLVSIISGVGDSVAFLAKSWEHKRRRASQDSAFSKSKV